MTGLELLWLTYAWLPTAVLMDLFAFTAWVHWQARQA